MKMEDELAGLKEIAIAKIKTAYNRSVALEATHSILWDKGDKNKKIISIITLIFGLISASSIIFTLLNEGTTNFLTYLIITDIFAILTLLLVIWETYLRFTGKIGIHGHILNEAYELRDKSSNFLQYKLDNLDKQGYIEELKSLEILDTKIKKKSLSNTKRISVKTKNAIEQKIEDLEKQGTKKYFMIKEEIDSANEKLQKFTALRTCEAWIKFD
ncbi:hypothetical protein LCGC14_0649860 [marine sediment metagenome]|uniref:SMODS and SLOG-associating 2TM effector domain-containing protein n=1 Tax=marine sediment metagenome TaxID=412755 RepID=A0A0F9RGC6_9ZZZZ|nr:MAG: hypothetical protein Lokiarch_08260 [Candidatus Lokiarchaeum sp. GC14_75]